MKKKILICATIAILIALCVNFSIEKSDNLAKSFILKNVEALAQSPEAEGKKIYSYQYFNDDCYIYVGGVYAKGKKVFCTTGKITLFVLPVHYKITSLSQYNGSN